MTDLATIRAKVYAATTEQHVPVLTRYEARLLFGRIEALEGVTQEGRSRPGRAGVIAALFVEERGVYADLPGVEVWGISRDARLYPGPYPVVCHPPCARWGRYWSGGPSAKVRRKLGDDGGCFEAALAAVRKWGGVLEHPEASYAWRVFGIPRPPRDGGWIGCLDGGWTCCVEQGHYGHRARKATWLYAYGFVPPALQWGASGKRARMDDGFHSVEERRRTVRTGICQRLSHRERAATPEPFRDLLLSMARMAERA